MSNNRQENPRIFQTMAVVGLFLLWCLPSFASVSEDAIVEESDYSGAQLNTREAFGYGLYVIEALSNDAVESTVTSFSLFSPKPQMNRKQSDSAASLAQLWRWNQIDWEFTPASATQYREETRCKGLYPTATCKSYRSDGENPLRDQRSREIEGHYTNNVLAASVRAALLDKVKEDGSEKYPQFSPKVNYSWDDLVHDTGEGRFFRYPNGVNCVRDDSDPSCPYPTTRGSQLGAWLLPPYLPKLSEKALRHSVAINVFRMPAGRSIIRRGPIESPHIEQCRGGTIRNCQDTRYLEAYAHASSEKIVNKRFDPYRAFHTYTIAVLPNKLVFFIDAPGHGLDLENTAPVKVMTIEDYPDLKMMGPQMPGGDLEWSPISGLSVLAPRESYQLGNLQWMVSMWMHPTLGGVPKEPFEATSTYIRRMSFYPMRKEGWNDGKWPFDTKPKLKVDFTEWAPEDWWFKFRKDFYITMTQDGKKSLFNVNWVDGSIDPVLEDTPALRVQINKKHFDGLVPHQKDVAYIIAPDDDVQGLRIMQARKNDGDHLSGEIVLGDYMANPHHLYAEVSQPEVNQHFYDYFPLFDNSLVAVEVADRDSPELRYCIYQFRRDGFKLVQGATLASNPEGKIAPNCEPLPFESSMADFRIAGDNSKQIIFGG